MWIRRRLRSHGRWRPQRTNQTAEHQYKSQKRDPWHVFCLIQFSFQKCFDAKILSPNFSFFVIWLVGPWILFVHLILNGSSALFLRVFKIIKDNYFHLSSFISLNYRVSTKVAWYEIEIYVSDSGPLCYVSAKRFLLYLHFWHIGYYGRLMAWTN